MKSESSDCLIGFWEESKQKITARKKEKFIGQNKQNFIKKIKSISRR